jgi:hypothetical protein
VSFPEDEKQDEVGDAGDTGVNMFQGTRFDRDEVGVVWRKDDWVSDEDEECCWCWRR